MDTSKQIMEIDKRLKAAQSVKLEYNDMGEFKVFDGLLQIKYTGFVKEKDWSCTCPSFEHGNSDIYLAEHGIPFACKHVLCCMLKISNKLVLCYAMGLHEEAIKMGNMLK